MPNDRQFSKDLGYDVAGITRRRKTGCQALDGGWLEIRLSLKDGPAANTVGAKSVEDRSLKTRPSGRFRIAMQWVAIT
jgi:hypothetical protein